MHFLPSRGKHVWRLSTDQESGTLALRNSSVLRQEQLRGSGRAAWVRAYFLILWTSGADSGANHMPQFTTSTHHWSSKSPGLLFFKHSLIYLGRRLACAATHGWRAEDSFQSRLSLSTQWDLGTQLRPQALAASVFTWPAVLSPPEPALILDICFIHILPYHSPVSFKSNHGPNV